MNIPTKEEYIKACRDVFVWDWNMLSEEEVDKFMESEDVKEYLDEYYDYYVEYLEKGKDAPVWTFGSKPVTVGGCLAMMY